MYKSKELHQTRTVYPKSPPMSTTQNRAISRVDSEGDTAMSGMNALKTQATKPRAPWRSQSDIEQARGKQACFRCLQTGHRSFKCPTYSSARPPAAINQATVEEHVETDELKE
ncbi:uncharacterized protein BROUX77_006075 [Berkeleyomyces rouxiae]|uniref:uncharacterized protein n=1 Tax=Berkeleyomyces rouxiae TaxID=2035830 RepID=UPI003B76044D